MSATADDIEITIDEDGAISTDQKVARTDETPVVEVIEGKKAPKTPVITPEDGIEKLKRDLAQEKSAREAAERRAQQASQAEVQARTQVQATELDVVKGGITSLLSAKEMLKQKYAEAAAAGDWVSAADAQAEMSVNAAELLQLKTAQARMEKAPKPAPSVPEDPVEKLASQLSPQSAAWVRAHPQFARDPNEQARMERAHNDALYEGFQPDTRDYFAYVEDRLKINRSQELQDDSLSEASRPKSNRSPPSAPVSRSGNGASPRSDIVRLTPDEVEMAALLKQTPEEYARNKLALKKEGKLN